jgi:type I restriction enzyme S subunit
MSDFRSGWARASLKELVTLTTGPFGSTLHKSDYVAGGVPIVNPMHIHDGKIVPSESATVSTATAGRLSEFQLRTGDIVLGRRGEMGRCAVVQSDQAGWLCGTGSVILRPLQNINAHYLQRFLSSPSTVNALISASVGSTMVNLNQGILFALDVPLPPIAEQSRIADKLDSLVKNVDACHARLGRVPLILKTFREAVLEAAVSGRLTEEWRARTGRDRHEVWKTTELASVCQPDRVITYGVIKLGADIASGVPCLRTSNVRWLRIDEDGIKRIAPALSTEYGRTILRGDEVLVNVRGTLGGVAAVAPHMIGWNVSREVAVVPAAAELVQARFLALWVATNSSQKWLTGVQKGVAYTGINIEDLRALPVRVPGLIEQSEIVRRVDALFSLADSLQRQYDDTVTRVEKLTPSVLAKAFRGELVPQDPNDEPAGEMLERVRASGSTDAPTTKIRAAGGRSG